MFKVGDWVEVITTNQPRTIKQVVQVSSIQDTVTISDGTNIGIILRSDLKLWIPESNEWCWFYDNFNNPFIGQFVKRDGDNYAYLHIGNNQVYSAYRCKPFIGKLPSF